MEEDDEIVKKVNETNTEFYRAFENLSIEMMDNLWKHDENIVCIHPGWDLFTGWLAIRESWITIFANTEMIKFTITNTKVRTFDKVGVVVCLENIETTSADGRLVKIGVIATNIFEKSDPNDSGGSNRSRSQCNRSRDASKQRGSIGGTSVRCNRSESLCVYERYLQHNNDI
jgi:ketosteroid isomerase-like protein